MNQNNNQNMQQPINPNVGQNTGVGVTANAQPTTQNISQQPATQQVQQVQNNQPNSDNNKGPSGFAKFMTILLFMGLFAFVYFLSDITEYINQMRNDKQIKELTSGKLTCTANKDSENLSSKIKAIFVFENKGIVSLKYQTTTSGDAQKDKKELKVLYDNCKKLSEEITDQKGIKVACRENSGSVVVTQNFDYKSIDVTKLKSSYSEAGGTYPEFKYKESINRVENKMISSDYNCEKSSN